MCHLLQLIFILFDDVIAVNKSLNWELDTDKFYYRNNITQAVIIALGLQVKWGEIRFYVWFLPWFV